MKKINPNQFKEKEGVNAIATRVNRMGCTWRPTPTDDYGIDGEIEINKEGTPTGKIIKVQSKYGGSYIRNLNASKFDFYADADDVEYWLSCNIPIILIVMNFKQNIFHWMDIKQYVKRHPEFRNHPHKITFNLINNKFTIRSVFNLYKMVLNEQEFVEVTKNKIQEEILSNLLPIQQLPLNIYSASTKYNLKEIFEKLRTTSIPPFHLAENRIWTFNDFYDENNSLLKVCDKNTIAVIKAQEWWLDENKKKWYIILLKRVIEKRCKYLGLLLDDDKKKFYLSPDENLQDRIIEFKAFARKGKRKVAYQYVDKNGIKRFWVHHAVSFEIKSFGGRWFLKIEPCYVFTKDGTNFVASSKVGRLNTRKKAKEWNRAVLNHLIFWREILSEGKHDINIKLGAQNLVISKQYESGLAHFGIMKDKTKLQDMFSFEDLEINIENEKGYDDE